MRDRQQIEDEEAHADHGEEATGTTSMPCRADESGVFGDVDRAAQVLDGHVARDHVPDHA